MDWVVTLPPLLNERLKQEVYDFEENKNMQLIGSWERSARQTGVVGYVTELVTARVGVLGTTLKSRLQNLTDQQLLELGLAVHSFQKKSDLTAWLKVQTVTPSTPHKRR